MTKLGYGIAAWLATAVLLSGAATATEDPAGNCCAKPKAENGWCDHCKVGYLNDHQIKSRKLFDALAGQKVDPAKVTCEGCKEPLKNNGYCDHCKVYFRDGKMYASFVSYELLAGKRVHPSLIACRSCNKAAEVDGRCGNCDKGYLDHRLYGAKEDYTRAYYAQRALLAAINAQDRCEDCAIALVMNATCDKCKVTYRNGVKKDG